jgi:hypothetical protein
MKLTGDLVPFEASCLHPQQFSSSHREVPPGCGREYTTARACLYAVAVILILWRGDIPFSSLLYIFFGSRNIASIHYYSGLWPNL